MLFTRQAFTAPEKLNGKSPTLAWAALGTLTNTSLSVSDPCVSANWPARKQVAEPDVATTNRAVAVLLFVRVQRSGLNSLPAVSKKWQTVLGSAKLCVTVQVVSVVNDWL